MINERLCAALLVGIATAAVCALAGTTLIVTTVNALILPRSRVSAEFSIALLSLICGYYSGCVGGCAGVWWYRRHSG